MRPLLMLAVLAASLTSCNLKTEVKVDEAKSPPPPMEFAEAKFSDICKKGLQGMESGDIEAFVSGLSDNCVYRFNNGDSLVGKPAIAEYWKDRRMNSIESIRFSNDIWLPVAVNESETVRTGTWVLGWFTTDATYKTGKSMNQSIHTLYHFDGSGQIDEVIQYMDRAPIMAAMSK